MLLRHGLHHDIQFARFQPLSPSRLKRLPRKACAGKLTALDCEANVRGAFVTIDHPDRQPERRVQHSRIIRGAAAGADAAEFYRFFCRKPSLYCRNSARSAESANMVIGAGRTEKLKLLPIELDA